MKLKSAVVICMEDKEITKEEIYSSNLAEYMHTSQTSPITGNRLVIVTFEATYGWFNNKIVTLVGVIHIVGDVYIFQGMDNSGYLMGYELDAINNYVENKILFGKAIASYKQNKLRQSLDNLVFSEK